MIFFTVFTVRFPGEKVHCVQNETDVVLLLRQVADVKKRVLQMREHRPCLLAENTEFTPNDDTGYEGTLKVRRTGGPHLHLLFQ